MLAVSGRFEPPYRITGVHARPIYSILPLLPRPGTTAYQTYDPTAASSNAQPAAATATATPAATDTAPSQPQVQLESKAQGTDGGSASVSVSGDPSSSSVASMSQKTGRYSVLLVTLSQDRLLAMTAVNLKLGPAQKQAKKTAKAAGPAEGKVGDATGSRAAAAGPAELAGPSQPSAALSQQAQAASQAVSATGTGTGGASAAPAANAGASSSTATDSGAGAGSSRPVLVLDEPTNAPRQRPPPVFHTARGPPSDPTIRGFGGRGAARAAVPDPPANPAPNPAAPADANNNPNQPAPGAQAAANGNINPPAPPPPTVTIATPSIPTGVAASVAHSSISDGDIGGGGAGAEGLASLAWYVAGHDPLWRLSGLGGYAHSVDVCGPRVGDAPVGSGAQQGHTEMVTGWEVVAGSGDRTVRVCEVEWTIAQEANKGRGACTRAPDTHTADTSAGSVDADVVSIATTGSEGVATGDKGAGSGAKVQGVRYRSERPWILSSALLWRGLSDQVLCVARHPHSSRELCPTHTYTHPHTHTHTKTHTWHVSRWRVHSSLFGTWESFLCVAGPALQVLLRLVARTGRLACSTRRRSQRTCTPPGMSRLCCKPTRMSIQCACACVSVHVCVCACVCVCVCVCLFTHAGTRAQSHMSPGFHSPLPS